MAEKTEADDFSLTAEEAALLRQGFQYCPRCRAEMIDKAVYDRVRRVCSACRFVQFIDPKVSAAAMVTAGEEILLVQRSMEPALGKWCFPGGFMDIGETPQEAAIRECREESGFEIGIVDLIDVFYYEDFRGSGVLIMYRGRLLGGQARPGDDTAAVDFFSLDNLPEIAFETNVKAIEAWQAGKI